MYLKLHILVSKLKGTTVQTTEYMWYKIHSDSIFHTVSPWHFVHFAAGDLCNNLNTHRSTKASHCNLNVNLFYNDSNLIFHLSYSLYVFQSVGQSTFFNFLQLFKLLELQTLAQPQSTYYNSINLPSNKSNISIKPVISSRQMHCE